MANKKKAVIFLKISQTIQKYLPKKAKIYFVSPHGKSNKFICSKIDEKLNIQRNKNITKQKEQNKANRSSNQHRNSIKL